MGKVEERGFEPGHLTDVSLLRARDATLVSPRVPSTRHTGTLKTQQPAVEGHRTGRRFGLSSGGKWGPGSALGWARPVTAPRQTARSLALGRLGPTAPGGSGTARPRPGPVSFGEPSLLSPRQPANRQSSARRAGASNGGAGEAFLSGRAGRTSGAGAGRPLVRALHSPLPRARSRRNLGPNSPRRLRKPRAARQLTSRQMSADSDWLRPEETGQYRRAVAPVLAPLGFRGGATTRC